MLDEIKALGFSYATKAGISIGVEDLLIPDAKSKLVDNADTEVLSVEGQYQEGAITKGERYNKVIEIWSDVTEKVADEMIHGIERKNQEGKEFNPIYIMADSGGSRLQAADPASWRGCVA